MQQILASNSRPAHETHHGGGEHHQRRGTEDFELRVNNEALMLAYLAGAPSQRTTALGASIDRNAIMGGGSRVCKRCGGAGVLEPKLEAKPKPKSRRRKQGRDMLELIGINVDEPAEPEPRMSARCGFDELIRPDAESRQGQTDRHEQMTDREIVTAISEKTGRSVDDIMCEFVPWCPRCRGNGVLPASKNYGKVVDRMPTGSSKQPWRNHDDQLMALCQFGAASTVMAKVAALNPVYEAVLVAYCGSVGARWAGRYPGKILAAYPWTQAGQSLLKSTMDLAGKLDPWERLSMMALGTDKERRTPRVRALLDAATQQAIAILVKSGHAWNTAVRRSGGARLKAARQHCGWTQQQLAERLGVPVLAVIETECGLQWFSDEYAERVVTCCGLTRDWKPEPEAKPAAKAAA